MNKGEKKHYQKKLLAIVIPLLLLIIVIILTSAELKYYFFGYHIIGYPESLWIYYIFFVIVFELILYKTKIISLKNHPPKFKKPSIEISKWITKMNKQQRIIIAIITPIVLYMIAYPIAYYFSDGHRWSIIEFDKTWYIWLTYLIIVGWGEYQLWGNTKE